MTIRGSMITAAIVAASGIAAAAAHAQVACGDNVTIKTAMTANLVCGTDPGFTVDAGGSVDMAGYSLAACGGCAGVTLAGQGAKLANGRIIGGGAGSGGVQFGGTGVAFPFAPLPPRAGR